MELYRPALLVLLYHSFFEKTLPDGWEQGSLDYMTTYERFNRDVELLTNNPKIQFTTPDEFFRMSVPANDRIYTYLTFDDGYKSILPALKRLKEENIPAAIFVNSDFIGTGELAWPEKLLCFFHHLGDQKFATRLNDHSWYFESRSSFDEKLKVFLNLRTHLKTVHTADRELFLDRLYDSFKFDLISLNGDPFYEKIQLMNWDDVKWIHETGFQVGGHTRTHPILALSNSDRIRKEIVEDKLAIEDKLNTNTSLFAIPNGQPQDYNDEVIQVCKESRYERIFSTSYGPNFLENRDYVLKRYDIGNFHLSADDVINQVCNLCLHT